MASMAAAPTITFRHEGAEKEIACDFIGGCDGSHGICRPSFPPGTLTTYERDYPFAWLGILAEAPPPERELIYAFHERGFALFSMRSPTRFAALSAMRAGRRPQRMA